MDQEGRDYFEALYKVARAVNASLEPGDVLDTIVRSVAKALKVKASGLRIVDRQGARLLMGASCGLSEGYIRKGPVTVADSGLDRKALGGQIIYIEDIQNDSDFQYPERAKAEELRSLLVVPLMVEGKAVGVLRAYSDQVRKFDDDEIKFLQAAADLAAIALENSRLHAALKRDYDLLIQHEFRLDDN